MDRAELDRRIAVIDAVIGPGHPAREDWEAVRGELRLRRRQSERAVPVAANAVQHFSAARAALDAGMEELGHIAEPPGDKGT
jgi:hypothetical protein